MQGPKLSPRTRIPRSPHEAALYHLGGWIYEWQMIHAKRKQPYLIAIKDNRPFGLVSGRWLPVDCRGLSCVGV